MDECELVESDHHKGFYLIPNFNRYSINRKGVVIREDTGKELKGSISKPNKERNWTGGYVRLTLTDDASNVHYTTRHRVVALTFHPKPKTDKKLIVNHKNGIPGDDRPENLEWVTYSENLRHALDNGLMPNKLMPIVAWNLKTDKVLKFRSREDAAEHFSDISTTEIFRRINNYPERVCEDHWVFKRDNDEPWVKHNTNNIYVGSVTQDVIIRNVFTGQCLIFNNCGEVARHLGLQRAYVLKHAKERLLIPTKGYNIRFLVNVRGDQDWPTHNERCLAIYAEDTNGKANGVVVWDEQDQVELFYPSVTKAANAFDITSMHVNGLVSKGTRYRKRYRFSFYRPKEHVKDAPCSGN